MLRTRYIVLKPILLFFTSLVSSNIKRHKPVCHILKLTLTNFTFAQNGCLICHGNNIFLLKITASKGLRIVILIFYEHKICLSPFVVEIPARIFRYYTAPMVTGLWGTHEGLCMNNCLAMQIPLASWLPPAASGD